MSKSYRHDLLTAAAKVLETMAEEERADAKRATTAMSQSAHASRETALRDLASVLADVALATP